MPLNMPISKTCDCVFLCLCFISSNWNMLHTLSFCFGYTRTLTDIVRIHMYTTAALQMWCADVLVLVYSLIYLYMCKIIVNSYLKILNDFGYTHYWISSIFIRFQFSTIWIAFKFLFDPNLTAKFQKRIFHFTLN